MTPSYRREAACTQPVNGTVIRWIGSLFNERQGTSDFAPVECSTAAHLHVGPIYLFESKNGASL